MELRDYLEVARKRWRLIAAVTLAVIALAAFWTIITPRAYASTTQFFVGTTTSADGNAAALQQSNTFTQARVKSYKELLGSPKVLDPVIAGTGIHVSSTALAKQITSTVPLDTVVIEVTVTDASAERATRIASKLGEVFPRVIADLERVQENQPSPVKVTVVRDATVNPTPVSPRPTLNLAVGGVLGLLLGFGAAVLRDQLDRRIRTQRDVSSVTNETVLGSVAFDSDASAHPLIGQIGPRSARAEAFRSLRTNLQFIDVADPPQSIVVTSSIAGEGKSTTAANLAFSLADAGQSVVIIEGDLRRPRLLEYLGFEGSAGLTDVLIGRLDTQDALQQFGRTTLWLLGSGPIPPNPSELLGSTRMQALIDDLVEQFDYVIIDAPPLLPVTDAAVVSTLVDGALVVVGADVVTRDQLEHALAALESVNANVLGLILNRVSAKEGSAYGTYGYRYEQDTDRRRAKSRQEAARPAAPEGPPEPAPPSHWETPGVSALP